MPFLIFHSTRTRKAKEKAREREAENVTERDRQSKRYKDRQTDRRMDRKRNDIKTGTVGEVEENNASFENRILVDLYPSKRALMHMDGNSILKVFMTSLQLATGLCFAKK